MKTRHWLATSLLALCPLVGAVAAETTVTLKIATPQGDGESVGTVRIVETRYGLVFYPQLTNLPAGLHGFHVHANPSCAPGMKDGNPVPADGAGGHMDPDKSGRHGEPWGDGHLGDLPALYVDPQGNATNPVIAPRLMRLLDVRKHALMVHAGGDNHADHPAPLGGGGPRIACGVIE